MIAVQARSRTVAVEFDNVNISGFSDQLVAGENWLAFQLLNASATSSDLFLLPELVKGALSGSTSGEIPPPQRENPTIGLRDESNSILPAAISKKSISFSRTTTAYPSTCRAGAWVVTLR